jgi:hypothetical protein
METMYGRIKRYNNWVIQSLIKGFWVEYNNDEK